MTRPVCEEPVTLRRALLPTAVVTAGIALVLYLFAAAAHERSKNDAELKRGQDLDQRRRER